MGQNNKNIRSTIPGHCPGAKVVKTKRHPNGDITSALQYWKKTLKESDNLQQLKDKKEYIKKSVTRRKELQRAKYIQSLQEND
jgi:ribosomal protein S21